LLATTVGVNAHDGPKSGHGGLAASRHAGFMPVLPNHPAGSVQARPSHPGSPHGVAHFDWWHRGHWWHGMRGRGFGWWWFVGPASFWYPGVIYPYPELYPAPELPPGYWYWCDFNLTYFPNVSYVPYCPTGWQAVPSFD
jgi:hypothetical protein